MDKASDPQKRIPYGCSLNWRWFKLPAGGAANGGRDGNERGSECVRGLNLWFKVPENSIWPPSWAFRSESEIRGAWLRSDWQAPPTTTTTTTGCYTVSQWQLEISCCWFPETSDRQARGVFTWKISLSIYLIISWCLHFRHWRSQSDAAPRHLKHPLPPLHVFLKQ